MDKSRKGKRLRPGPSAKGRLSLEYGGFESSFRKQDCTREPIWPGSHDDSFTAIRVCAGQSHGMTLHDLEIGNQMGVNTWGTFAGADDRAVVEGDFAIGGGELATVLKTVRAACINIVATPINTWSVKSR